MQQLISWYKNLAVLHFKQILLKLTVQRDAKVTLYLTGLDGTAVNLVACTGGLALPRDGLKLAFLIIEG